MRSRARFKSLITLVLIVVVLLGSYLLYREGSLPVNIKNTTPQMFIIRPGEGLNEIATSLKSEGLIRNRLVFMAIVKLMGIEKNIQAGDFRLNQAMSAEEVAKFLTHGTVDLWVTIIEGLRKEEIAEILRKDFHEVSEAEFISKAEEGYLFPDTYLMPREASADAAINILTGTFEQKITPQMEEGFNRNNLTQDQAVILASIVEREAKFSGDRKPVASIFLRRIAEGMPLQADATVQYALGYQEDEKNWWKKALTFDDLKYPSPYNTYLNAGLPPAPISNPGLASLQAVADADADTLYLFYISDSSGRMHYGRNLDEHNANIEKYLR